MGSLGAFMYALGSIKYNNTQNVLMLGEITVLLNMIKDLVGFMNNLNTLTPEKRY